MSNWATDMVEALAPKNQKNSNNNNLIFIGEIVNVNPLKVSVNGQLIERHLYINSAYQLLSDNSTNLIERAFSDGFNLKGDIDGIQRVPKTNTTNATVDKHIDYNFLGNPINADWFDFLKEFHKRFTLVKGDKVILIKNETMFYVVSKVVAV